MIQTTDLQSLQRRASVFVLLLLAAASSVHAAMITASDNAYVFKNDPAADQNENSQLMIKSNGNNSYSRLAYLRFDISGLNTTDTVFLDLNVELIGSGSLDMFYVWSLKDGAGETGWSSSLTYNSRPDGTGELPTADLSAVGSKDYIGTGVISIPIDSNDLETILTNDTNNELTLVLGNNPEHTGSQCRLTSIGTSGGNLKPRLRALPAADITTILESGYGGSLREQNESTFSYSRPTAAKVGEGGSGNDSEYIQIMLFELPARPAGGFQDTDTSLIITIQSEDVVTAGEYADLWAIGYVPAEDIANVGADLNDGGVTDVDDFWLSESDSEVKSGWNIGSTNTVKIWDNLAASDSVNTLASPPAANTSLTSFINDLYEYQDAEAGDYLALRLTYDTDMTDYDDWTFYTGTSSSNKPELTLTLYKPSGTSFAFE